MRIKFVRELEHGVKPRITLAIKETMEIRGHLICKKTRARIFNSTQTDKGTSKKQIESYKFLVKIKLKYNLVESPRKFIIAKLSIRKLGSSSVLIIMRLI